MDPLKYLFEGKLPAPENYEQVRLDWANNSYFEKKEVYDCPVCKDKGIVYQMGSLGLPVALPCQCAVRDRERERYGNALASSGLGGRFLKQTFDNFQTQARWMEEMKRTAKVWAEGNVGWLLLCGQSGCGKTHLGLAACKERLDRRGQVPLVLSWRDYFSSQSKTQDKEQYLEKLRKAKEAALLYIDDFLKTARNCWDIPAWEQDLAFELLDYRYNAGLDTVISTEWTPRELLEMNEAIGGRILHAAGRNLFVVSRDSAKNHRLNHRQAEA